MNVERKVLSEKVKKEKEARDAVKFTRSLVKFVESQCFFLLSSPERDRLKKIFDLWESGESEAGQGLLEDMCQNQSMPKARADSVLFERATDAVDAQNDAPQSDEKNISDAKRNTSLKADAIKCIQAQMQISVESIGKATSIDRPKSARANLRTSYLASRRSRKTLGLYKPPYSENRMLVMNDPPDEGKPNSRGNAIKSWTMKIDIIQEKANFVIRIQR